MTPPEPTDHRHHAADTASCSALAARLQHEAALVADVGERLQQGDGDRSVLRELDDVVADMELVARALRRHVDAQVRAQRLPAQRAVSEEGRARHALLRACRRVRRAPGK